MNDQDTDKLLEQGLSGNPPGRLFQAQVLRDSTAAFVRARRSRPRRQPAALSAAAVFIAAVSFLLGRHSAPPSAVGPLIASPDTVAVPKDLVASLSAARLFKQLGMEDRMNRALDCADRLLRREAIAASSAGGLVLSGADEVVESQAGYVSPSHQPGSPPPVEGVNRILAESLGGYYHASEMD